MSAKPKILLVDDEPATTGNLAPFLERAGFTVTVAADEEAALCQADSFAPDLIILDVLMPKMDGREALHRLRQAGNWTPIILLTQVGESAERAMALEEGADDYLNKPFDPLELVARIQAVLRRARPDRPPHRHCTMSAEWRPAPGSPGSQGLANRAGTDPDAQSVRPAGISHDASG
jgi:DNA-binding response OmpR family regulator